MRRRHDRVPGRTPLVWWPLLAVAGLLVAAGALDRVYRSDSEKVTSYGVMVIGLVLIAAYTYRSLRRWWR